VNISGIIEKAHVWEELMGSFFINLWVFLYITPIDNESFHTDSVLNLPIYGIDARQNEVIGQPSLGRSSI